jgi:hypothetical protein
VTTTTGKPATSSITADSFQRTLKLFQAWAGNFQNGSFVETVGFGGRDKIRVVDLPATLSLLSEFSEFSEAGISGLS